MSGSSSSRPAMNRTLSTWASKVVSCACSSLKSRRCSNGGPIGLQRITNSRPFLRANSTATWRLVTATPSPITHAVPRKGDPLPATSTRPTERMAASSFDFVGCSRARHVSVGGASNVSLRTSSVGRPMRCTMDSAMKSLAIASSSEAAARSGAGGSGSAARTRSGRTATRPLPRADAPGAFAAGSIAGNRRAISTASSSSLRMDSRWNARTLPPSSPPHHGPRRRCRATTTLRAGPADRLIRRRCLAGAGR